MDRDTRLLKTALLRGAGIVPTIRVIVPAYLLVRPLRVIADHPESTEHEKSWGLPALEKLKEACNAPLEPFNAHGRKLISGLVDDCVRYGMAIATERRERAAMWAYLAILYWLEKALDDNPSLLVENGPLHHAAYALLEAGNRHQDLMDEMDRSAQRGAVRLAVAFDRICLFPAGASVKVAAAA